jgi:diguanylate cyclase (GGDEF)-like protein/putative nucleotidyltransferase with HDIG domain
MALILCGIVAGTGLIWTLFQAGRTGGFFHIALGVAAMAAALGFGYGACRLQVRLLERVRRHADEMTDLFNSTLSTLALAIDAKDKHRQGHTQRVQKYARAIAAALHLDRDQITGIAAAALLHDIGKLAVPEYILNKRGPLTLEEMRKMRMHPQLGADIISNIRFPFPVAETILAHHERFDGTGYPKGLAGKDIPLGARVLAVADAFDAYISDRIENRETLEGAIQFVRDGAGSAFDPDIAAVWESMYRDVVVWPSTSASEAHTGIQQATSELRALESLARSVEGLKFVHGIFLLVRAHIAKTIAGCTATIERGERPGIHVVFGGRVLATISVDRPEQPLNEDELRRVHAIAAKIAPALSSAMAIEAARREATLDKLTNLPNRRAFEMMCGSLDRQHFSVIVIDVNSFKAVNDNFGHNAGDATLVRIAGHLRTAFHDAHLLCRLGGDEFLVLSFAAVRTLRMQMRRFRRRVAQDPAHTSYRNMLFGVSCGLASIPLDAKNIEQAIQCADERMYAFKARYKRFAGAATGGSLRPSTKRATTSQPESIQSPYVLKK